MWTVWSSLIRWNDILPVAFGGTRPESLVVFQSSSQFIQFANYAALIGADPQFLQVFLHTILFVGFFILICLLAGLGIAAVLDQRIHGKDCSCGCG